MILFDEMPTDNAELASLSVEFERLDPDSAETCPLPLPKLVEYLARRYLEASILTPAI